VSLSVLSAETVVVDDEVVLGMVVITGIVKDIIVDVDDVDVDCTSGSDDVVKVEVVLQYDAFNDSS